MAFIAMRVASGRDLNFLVFRSQYFLAKRGRSDCGEIHSPKYMEVIGNRDIVGYGMNHVPSYIDYLIRPFPAIRFRENTPEIIALKEKEKGDWHKLTIEEKKTLYRHSFCLTYAEMLAPEGSWKLYVAGFLWTASLALILLLLEKIYLFPPLPESFLPDNMRKALKAHLVNHTDEILGISSKWDYENNCWKKK